MDERTRLIATHLALALVVGAGAFLWGTSVGESRASATREQFFRERGGAPGVGSGQFVPGGAGPNGPFGGREGLARGAVRGTVVGAEGDTVTVETEDGPVEVLVDDDTVLSRVDALDLGDLEAGEPVVVVGSRDAEGLLVARSIQVGAGFRAPDQ